MNSSKLFTLALTFNISLALCAHAQTLRHVADFTGTNGSGPYGSMVQGTDGNFYGAAKSATYPYTEIFRVTPAGKITVLYSFCSLANCADGMNTSAPVLGIDGNLYGVTYITGKGPYNYSGTFYKLTLAGTLTTLYTFCPTLSCTLDEIPRGIVAASDGSFYGITWDGGAHGSGSIFRMTSGGKFTQVYSFCSLANCADGGNPLVPPIQGSDGNFYGAAQWGTLQDGVVYQMTPSGSYRVLRNYCYNCIDGGFPTGLVDDGKGDLFGTTAYSSSYNSGTIFEITPTMQYTVLHNFVLHGGVDAVTGLMLASDGNFYGVANNDDFDRGGSYSNLYKITPAGEYTTLDAMWINPNGPLVQGTDGNIYGSTLGGGLGPYKDDGTIFKLVGLNPYVKIVPQAAKAGQRILILGNHLTGTTSVTFNGMSAAFTVESDTYIKATVPEGATTGTVTVATPARTLNSNPQFVVMK